MFLSTSSILQLLQSIFRSLKQCHLYIYFFKTYCTCLTLYRPSISIPLCALYNVDMLSNIIHHQLTWIQNLSILPISNFRVQLKCRKLSYSHLSWCLKFKVLLQTSISPFNNDLTYASFIKYLVYRLKLTCRYIMMSSSHHLVIGNHIVSKPIVNLDSILYICDQDAYNLTSKITPRINLRTFDNLSSNNHPWYPSLWL